MVFPLSFPLGVRFVLGDGLLSVACRVLTSLEYNPSLIVATASLNLLWVLSGLLPG